MRGYYRRHLEVVWAFLPFLIAFLRDRRRFILIGPRRRVPDSTHRRRAQQLAGVMLDLGPAFVKVGQVLSTRPDLVPPMYAEEFESLQDRVPEDVGGDPLATLDADLGGELDMDTVTPLAGGSLAHVYTAEHEGRRLALKIRRPGVTEIIDRDLEIIDRLITVITPWVEERTQYSMENVAEDFREIIHDELDFERERRVMREITEDLEDVSDVKIPTVYDAVSTERIIAMEYVPGTKVTDPSAFSETDADPHDTAELIARTYLRMGLIEGTFHADPHPGNLAIDDEGRLVIYDFGMSQRLTPQEQEDIADLYRALVRRDVDELLTTLVSLGVLEPTVDRKAARQLLELVIENLEGRTGITWHAIMSELFGRLRQLPIRIPPNVLLLMRVGTVGEGVCRDLDPEFDFIAVVRDFLIDHGLIESELRTLAEDLRNDLRASLPALGRAPARFDRVFGQLERGELVVHTDPVDGGPGRQLVYAIVGGALVIAGAILTFHPMPYEVGAALALLYVVVRYVRRAPGR